MKKLISLIPENSLNLVKYSGKELINKLGNELISKVVLSLLCGDNIRNLTEGLTQRRILLMNSSLFITYLKALSSIDNFTSSLSKIVNKELRGKISPDEAISSLVHWSDRQKCSECY